MNRCTRTDADNIWRHDFTYPDADSPPSAIARCLHCGMCIDDHELRELLWFAQHMLSYERIETARSVGLGW